jgi:hypothetical protein
MTSSREQKASTRMIISAVQPFALGNTDEVFGFCWGGEGVVGSIAVETRRKAIRL